MLYASTYQGFYEYECDQSNARCMKKKSKLHENRSNFSLVYVCKMYIAEKYLLVLLYLLENE